MATFRWDAGTTGDWNTAGDWRRTGGKGTPIPGTSSAATDTAKLGRGAAYAVTIKAGEHFDIATLDIAGKTAAATTLSISGALFTNGLNYTGAANAAKIDVNAGGLLDIRNEVTATKAQTLTVTGTGTGGLLEFGSATTSGININSPNVTFSFADAVSGPSAGVIEFNGPVFTIGGTTDQKISGAAWGDRLVFDHANFTGDTFTYSSATQTLIVESGGTTVLTMDNLSGTNLTSKSFEVGALSDTILIVCYARGTMLRTPDGELPVERLGAGRQVITLVDGQEVPKTVTWLGHRRVNIADHPRPETVAPVRIRRDAFAEGMPHRDLIVSPDHAIFVDGKLICARQLVNGSSIRQERDRTAVDYYHVQLDHHAILLAEGLPAESYLDTGNSGFFDNSGAPLVLHPDLTDETDYPTREAGSCAPFVWDEASVFPVWQRLADRAAATGLPLRATTTDADLRLFGKYRTAKPIYADSNLIIFNLPRGANEIRLRSRAQSPTEARPWLDDRRKLGVRVKRIVLRGTNDLREVPMDHPDLTEGWWDIEHDGQVMSRWTNGDAAVPLPAMDGQVMLEVHLVGEMIYALKAEPDIRRAAA
jgi:hypothetical protein